VAIEVKLGADAAGDAAINVRTVLGDRRVSPKVGYIPNPLDARIYLSHARSGFAENVVAAERGQRRHDL
jgi:hypothetical protein